MRIAIVIGPFLPIPPVLGGAVEKVHLLMAAAFRAAGHDVTMISRRYRNLPREQVVEGIKHIRIPSFGRTSSLIINLILDLFYSVHAARSLPSADVTITNGFFLPLLLPHRRAGKIYVQVGRYPKHQMLLYFRADRLQAVSSAVADAIAQQAPWLAHKVAVIGYAISDAYFRPCAMLRREKTILFVGRLAHEKGVTVLLRAIAILLQRRSTAQLLDEWKLRIVGPHVVSQGGDGVKYLRELQALAGPLGSRCEFVGPVFEEEKLIREYQSSSVFVYPSLAEFGESFGLAPLEAMAAGCAVIVSNLQCFDDYIVDGITGLKFDHRAESPEEQLTLQLARLMTDATQLQRIADAGRDVARRFQANVIARQLLDDFAMLLGDRTC
jgi:glycosyltransferase involved in cell wall biosynthesis